MTPVNLFDHLGRPIRLGQKLGTGGEGAVFEVVAASDLVAKVYHKAPPARTVAKLRKMVALARDELIQIAAWPTATLHQRPGGPTLGLMMRRIRNFKELHTLYSPAQRKMIYPQADWRFLVTTAINCAAALENLHSCGVVVGDVNQSNVLVSDAGLIALIDCDSFQIQANGQLYPCDVGVPLFTPPELQGQNFRGLNRTPNHDRFGLAVLIFHLRFAYGRSARSYQMQTPMHALPLSAVSPQLVDLFERAFSREASQGNTRPTGADWHHALKGFLQSLRPCSSDQGHVYASHLPSCPWCNLMKHGAPNFFISVAFFRHGQPRTGPVFVLATVWARIEQVRPPNLTYQPPVIPQGGQPNPLPPGLPMAVPTKPILPAILRSQPLPPPALTVRPPLPAILASPPSLPAHLSMPVPKGILAPPLPTILTAPPPAPAIVVPRPSRQKEVLPSSFLQRTAGIAAIVCGIIFPPFLFLLVPVGALVLITFAGFGLLWGILEDHRRREQHKANEEYETQVAELQAAAKRKLRQWKQWLAAEQAKAKQDYERRLAAQQAKAKQQYEEQLAVQQAKAKVWRDLLAAEQAKAKRQYDEELATQGAQLKAYNEKQAAERAKANQQYETELQTWQQAVAALRNEVAKRRQSKEDAEQRLRAAETNWTTRASWYRNHFEMKKSELREMRARQESLAREYAEERQRLQFKARDKQFDQFLQQQFISNADIPDIGPTRKATLSSFGIETAFDVERYAILQIQGFGPKLANRLIRWRREIEGQFVFNPAVGIPPQEQQALDLKFAQSRQHVESRLLAGEGELQAIVKQAESELRQLHEYIQSCLQSLVQTQLDLKVLPNDI
jgi:DNA-binding helix-hairpin-helix protein with protein kinase domain